MYDFLQGLQTPLRETRAIQAMAMLMQDRLDDVHTTAWRSSHVPSQLPVHRTQRDV